jgi:carbamoyl-phosphate synthase large subunit
LQLKQPENATAMTFEEAHAKAHQVGFPLVVRPSYVLGGRAMEIASTPEELDRFLADAFAASEEQPVLLDRYLRRAIEVDVDALCDGREVVIAGIMEHIEQAGIHSGDSACSLPPRSLTPDMQAELARQARLMALDLGVVGLMNVQFAVADGVVYVLEVNPRASRTVPFVAKATGFPLAKIAARAMAGASLAELDALTVPQPAMISVKEAVLPFRKFPGVDVMLGPEMKSTGETMGSGVTFAEAYAKAQLGAGVRLPMSGRVVLRVDPGDAELLVGIVTDLQALGFTVAAGDITADALAERGLALERVEPEHRLDGTALVLASGRGAAAFRRAATKARIPCYTTIAGLAAGVLAIGHLRRGPLTPLHLGEVQRPASR